MLDSKMLEDLGTLRESHELECKLGHGQYPWVELRIF